MSIYGFMHIYAANHWKKVVKDQVEKIKTSGLYGEVDQIFYGVVGNANFEIDDDLFTKLYSTCEGSEVDTINLITPMIEDSSKVFYIHTKGVTKPNMMCHQDWRIMMEYFIIEKYQDCLRHLDNADVVGVNWHYGNGYRGSARVAGPHFSGNFWWANADYLQKLPELNEETSLYKSKEFEYLELPTRWDAEFWIGRAKPKVVELWNSNIHHGSQRCQEYKYKNAILVPRVIC